MICFPVGLVCRVEGERATFRFDLIFSTFFSCDSVQVTDDGGEILPETIKKTFDEAYLHTTQPFTYEGHKSAFDSESSEMSNVTATLSFSGERKVITGEGNGPLSAFKNALSNDCGIDITLVDYQEHAMGTGADAAAIAYVEIEASDRSAHWGVGLHPNIVTASFHALLSAINRSEGS